MKRIRLLRELGLGMEDVYTRKEAMLVCREEIFSRAWDMDAALLLEALRALDDRPRESACPHMEQNERRLMRAIEADGRRSARKLAAGLAAAALLILLAAGCAAWAYSGGVLSFMSEAPDIVPVPEVTGEAAQALVQRELAVVRYAACELRVREAAFDGHQLRIVYSTRDTRRETGAIDVAGGYLEAEDASGLSMCDFVTVNGQDVYFCDAAYMAGEEGELLHYLAANLPKGFDAGEMLRVELPVGKARGYGRPREQENVRFTLSVDTAGARSAREAVTVWGDVRVSLERLELSPMHGLLEATMTSTGTGSAWADTQLTLCGEDGLPVGYEGYSCWGGSQREGYVQQITQFTPTGAWPDALYIAELGEDGRMNPERCLRVEWQ